MLPYDLGATNDLRTGCASLLRGTGIPPPVGALGLGKPLLNPVDGGLLAGFVKLVVGAAEGPGGGLL